MREVMEFHAPTGLGCMRGLRRWWNTCGALTIYLTEEEVTAMAVLDDSTCLIDVSTKKRPDTFALVDKSDLELVSGFNWHIQKDGHVRALIYASSANGLSKRLSLSLGRVMLSPDSESPVYQKNGNDLDFRRCNLTTIKPRRCRPEPSFATAPDGCRLIDMSTPKKPRLFSIVDAEMFDEINSYRWLADSNGYARTRFSASYGNSREVYMHRMIFGLDTLFEVDHINGNPHDNRRINLRAATREENMRNQIGRAESGLKGAAYIKSKGCYVSAITVKGKKIALGHFGNAEAAHAAYCAASIRLHGEYSNTLHRDDRP